MNAPHRSPCDEAFAAHLENRPDALDPTAMEPLALREADFRAGWLAADRRRDADVEPGSPNLLNVRALTEPGDRAWVQPLAIVQHMASGQYFVDPLFPASRARSPRVCVELVVTDLGLVAHGFANQHRLSPSVDHAHLIPLAAFELG